MKKSVLFFISTLLAFSMVCYADGPYKILSLIPEGHKVLIGAIHRKSGDIIYSNQMIKWDKNNHGFIAYDINKPSRSYEFTKARAYGKNMTVATYIKSLMGKGTNNIPILCRGQKYELPIEVNEKYTYKLLIGESVDFIPLTIVDGRLSLYYSSFKGYEGIVEYKILQEEGLILTYIYSSEVEIVNL